MCLGAPGKVIELFGDGSWVVTESFGVRRKVGTQLLEKVELGDYIMVHAGYAIEKIDLLEARERIKLWEEFLKV